MWVTKLIHRKGITQTQILEDVKQMDTENEYKKHYKELIVEVLPLL